MQKTGYLETYNMICDKFPNKIAITVSEAAEVLGANVGTVYAAIRRVHNPLPSKKLGGKVLISITALARWLC